MVAPFVIWTALMAAALPSASTCQYSFTIWDWDTSYRDIQFFQQQVDACAQAGFTRIELGVGWRDCEPRAGKFDFTIVDERVKYVRSKGLDIRLRVNVAHWPDWYNPEKFEMPDGTPFGPGSGFPSVFSARNREHQYRFVSALASHFAGQEYTYTPGFSVHMEVKFSDWNSYEPSARKAFQDWLAGRYGHIEELNRAWQASHASFSSVAPPVPGPTAGEPSLDPVAYDWVCFREWGLAEWVRGFAASVRAADASARISVPLGESYRRQSAAFANLDYWGYSREADEVVHSYDFFWHGTAGIGKVSTAVATMTGITQRPVVFEIDGPYVIENFGYTIENYRTVGNLARKAGAAGVQVSNWGGVDVRTQPWMKELGEDLRALPAPEAPSGDVLYYVSKWANYCYREPDESLYERQFGLWSLMQSAGVPARIVTDENLLHESLDANAIVIPCAPVMDASVRERLRALSFGMRVVCGQDTGVYTPTQKTRGSFGAKLERVEGGFPQDSAALAALLSKPNPESRMLRVAAVQFRTKFDVGYNADRILEYLREAAAQDVDVVAFTELALTGYSKRAEFGPSIDWAAVDQAVERIRATCRELQLCAIVGAPTRDGDALFCSALAVDSQGEVVDAYEKTYLAGEAWATPGRKFTVFPVEGVSCGTFICHDERYPHLVQLRAMSGAQLFFYISCESGLADEHKINPYRAQIQARAVENGVYIVHANTPARSGELDAEDASHGQSRIVAPDGNLICEADTTSEEMIVATIDLRHARKGGGAALEKGPAKEWIKEGLELVTGQQ
ncbi:MAG: beta-galactosidase [Candidatus Hydrogenedentes bacterium]|nr:beta-galactosidase [Candidatus Hydrogenedentota bacterium]